MELFDSAWNDFKRMYKEKQISEDGYYLCWNESDLVGILRHFLMEHIEDDNLFIHTGITRRMSFGDPVLHKNWKDTWKSLKKYIGDIDLVIYDIDKKNFVLIVEFKYLHRPQDIEDVKASIKKGRDTLLALKKHKVTREICYVVVDAYYHRQGNNELKPFLKGLKNINVKLLKG